MNFTILALIGVLAIISTVYAADGAETPRVQVESGTDPAEVVCNAERVLMLRTDGRSICVKESTAGILTERNLATLVPDAPPADTMESVEARDVIEIIESVEDGTDAMDGEGMDAGESAGEDADDAKEEIKAAESMENNDADAQDIQTVDLVNLMVAEYDSHGGEETFTVIDNRGIAGEGLHPFVVMPETLAVLASGTESYVVGDVLGMAEDFERPLDEIETDIAEDGNAWVHHAVVNSASGEEEKRRSYILLHDEYYFGAGYALAGEAMQTDDQGGNSMEDGADFTGMANQDDDELVISLVDHILQEYDTNGKNATFDIITGGNITGYGDLYPFVLEPETLVVLAHGNDPGLVGIPALSTEDFERPYEEIEADLAEDGNAWVHYVFLNPASGEDQRKRSYMVLHDGHYFGSGYHISKEAGIHEDIMAEDTAEEVAEDTTEYPDDMVAVSLVNHIVQEHMKVGGQDTFAQITMRSITGFGDLYPFVLEAETLVVRAHGSDPTLVGKTVITTEDFERPYEEIEADLAEDGNAWVHYVFMNPASEEEERKRTYLVLHDDLLFGAGHHMKSAE